MDHPRIKAIRLDAKAHPVVIADKQHLKLQLRQRPCDRRHQRIHLRRRDMLLIE
jgi:hypothetical protein